MKTEAQKRVFCLALLLLLALLTTGLAMASEPSRVVIVPFRVHSDSDLSFLSDGLLDMLTMRLSQEDEVVVVSREETAKALKDKSPPVTESAARAFGKQIGAEYVLFGSVAVFGNSVSLDCKMVDVHQKMPTLTFSREGNEIDMVIPQVGLFASEIKEKLFERPVSLTPKVAVAPAEFPSTYARPETPVAREPRKETKVSRPEPAPEATPGLAGPGSTTPADRTIEDMMWKSQPFKFAVLGVALGDVDGDTKTELVLVDDRHIYVHRLENRKLLRIKEITGQQNTIFIPFQT